MDKALLDTDIFSEILKGKNRQVAKRATAYRETFARYTISSITVMEIVKGFHKINREDKIQKFLSNLSALEVLTLDVGASILTGRIIADLERKGRRIGRADCMIAAVALRYDLTLVTGNWSHYQGIQTLGYPLKLDNWRT